MLTAEQITCFNTFGCLVFRQIFSPEEIEAITRAAEEVWEKELGRQPGEEEPITTDPFVEKHPRLTQLVEDDRIYQPMAQLLGKDFIWSSSEGNRGFSPGQDAHHWHADRHGIEELNYTRIKIMLYPGCAAERRRLPAGDSRFSSVAAARRPRSVPASSRGK